MPEYLVKVADERGRMMEQVETGRSEAEIRDRIAQQGLLVYSVRQRGVIAGGVSLRRRKIKLDQFVVFNQQFLTLIRAGLTVVHALDLLIKRQPNSYFKALLENIRDRVKSGEPISEAFDAQHVFPKVYTTTLLAGERSGNLEEVLGRYVAFQRLLLSFRKKVLSSLIYPAVLVTAMTLVLAFLFTYVVPRFAELYANLNRQLPAITTFTITIGQAAQKYFIVILALIAVGVIVLVRWSGTTQGGQFLDRLRIKMPLIGPVWLKYQVAVFSRMLATLLSGGLPLVPSLQTASASIGSRSLAVGIEKATIAVKEGRPLARSLEESSLMPGLSVEMIEVGESTGALPQMLTSVAEFYEEDVQNSLAAAMSLIEPAILIVMAFVIGYVLLSLYMPIFSIGAGGGLG